MRWSRFFPGTIAQRPASPTAPADWWVAWGRVDAIADMVTWRDGAIAVGASAHQFTLSPKQRFVVVGDIWLPDRTDLVEKVSGEPGSDLELVAALWERYETATWSLLLGAFALVIWDRDRQVLWLGRDRAGVRTLYYTTTGTIRRVAPRSRHLTPYVAADLDLVALRDYLCCAFVPGDRTLRQQIREVRPGCSVNLTNGTVQPYWQLQEQVSDRTASLQWHGSQLRSLLEQVVQSYLPPQEPVGVFLSGGLDSSGVTALVAKLHHAPVHTYSIHFGADCPHELEFSSLVATHCQTTHHILEITFRDMWEQLPRTMAALDDPIGDPLTVPNLLLGQLASASVGVVLNGEGGDPCFGGPKNQPMLINALYGSVTRQDALQAYLVAFQKCATDLPQLLKPAVWAAIQEEPVVFAADLTASASYLNRLMSLNIKFKGADHILTKVNNLTHAVGIEGRSPLFDPRIVAYSMQIPPEYKLSGVQEKAVLKQALVDLLPAEIINRPKSGMMVPVQLGFRQYWNRQTRRLLLSKQAAIAPYLNQSVIRDWLNYQGDTWNRYGVKLWLLVSLELWLTGDG